MISHIFNRLSICYNMEKRKFYYRYFYGKISAFSALERWVNNQTKKRYGTKEWLKEHEELTRDINKAISWLPEPEFERGTIFFFKKRGAKKFEKTLFRVHKRVLASNKITKKRFSFLKKTIEGKNYLYKDNRRVGIIVYEDKYQIGVI